MNVDLKGVTSGGAYKPASATCIDLRAGLRELESVLEGFEGSE